MATSGRPRSPPRRYPYGDPRVSTGTVFASSFDGRPSTRYDRAYEAQPIGRRVDDRHGGGATSTTNYVVRPRQNSLLFADESRRSSSALIDPRNRTPVNSNGRERPQRAHDDSDRFLHPGAADARQYHHQRHHSATPHEMDRLIVANRDGRERGGYHRSGAGIQKSYPITRPPIRYNEEDGYSYTGPREQFERDYPVQPPQKRDNSIRRERPASVIEIPKQPTSSRRDMPPPSAASRQIERSDRPDQIRHPRPIGELEQSRLIEMPQRRQSTRNPVVHQARDDGYSSQRDDYDRKRSSRRRKDRYDDDDEEQAPRQPDRDHNRHPRAHESRRPPRSRDVSPERQVVGRPSEIAGIDSRRPQRSWEGSPERIAGGRGLAPPDYPSQRRPRSRDNSPDKSGITKGLAAVGLGGLAATGLANGLSRDPRSKDEESDSEARRERRRRRRKEREREREAQREEDSRLDGGQVDTRDQGTGRQEERSLPEARRINTGKDQSESDSTGDAHRSHRRRRRRHRRDQEPDNQELPSDYDSDHPPPILAPDDPRRGRRNSDLDTADRRRPGPPEEYSRDLPVDVNETRTLSPGENEDDRPRRVAIVEPVKDKEQESKPRGILKPPRSVPFPEDPNPTREGVAPLKQAEGAKVPPELQQARWTKISRMLVNPEALDQARERYEERDDYVIVLRVVTKEEIGKLAEKTREIREAREREWQEELEERRRKGKGRRHPDPHSDEDEDEAENARGPLPLPEPPLQAPNMVAAGPLDPRMFQASHDPLGRSIPNAAAAPILNVVPENYSHNV